MALKFFLVGQTKYLNGISHSAFVDLNKKVFLNDPIQYSNSTVVRNIRVGSSSQVHLTGMSGSVSTDRHVRGTREGTEGRGSCFSCHSISWLNGEETGMDGGSYNCLVKVADWLS